MTTRHLLHDAGHCLHLAAPPMLALGVLTATRSVLLTSPTLSASAGRFLLAWHVAVVAAELWLVASVCWAASRPWRDRRASQRLQHLRDLVTGPNRALVHVTTVFWTDTAGQHAVVVNVATGIGYRVWIPETEIPVGDFAVLESAGNGPRVIARLSGQELKAARRHECRWSEFKASSTPSPSHVSHCEELDDAATLIDEVEAYLRGR